jgi:hypothetical protein
MPISRAMVGVDHCVALAGLLWVVFSITEALEIDSERLRSRRIFQWTLDAMFDKPPPPERRHAGSKIWLRSATRACVERPRDCCSNFRRTPSLRTMDSATNLHVSSL